MNAAPTSNANVRRAAVVLAVVGVGWLAWLIWMQADSWTSITPQSYLLLGLSLLLLVVATLPTGLFFAMMVRSQPAAKDVSVALLVRLYLVGQVARYLPGRFFGVAYQLAASRGRVDAVSIGRANVDLMLLTTVGNLVFGGSVYWYFFHGSATLLVVTCLAGCALTALPHRLTGIAVRRLSFVLKRLPPRWQSVIARVEDAATDDATMWRAALGYGLSWTVYLGAWYLLLTSFGGLSDLPVAALTGAYAISWVVGFVSAVTPGGIGVREGAFLFLAQPLAGTADLAFVAILARLWLLVADLLLVLLVTPILALGERKR